MKLIFKILVLITITKVAVGQGYNHQWLIGNQWLQTVPKGRIVFDSISHQYQTEYRKMAFEGTQGNICNANGDFLMSSNGVWIANANNDTMLNGSGLNPGYFVSSYPNGLLISNGNFFIPTPGDTTGFTLFHETEVDPISANCNLFYSTIDLKLDMGLGGVVTKNNTIPIDSIGWGLNACKHANGRDWWIFSIKNYSNVVFKILYTINGIASIDSQALNTPAINGGILTQFPVSLNGELIAYSTYDNPVDRNSYIVLCDFDRCTGVFSNTRVVPVYSGAYIWGMTFSPSGQYLYCNTSYYIFQINTATLQVDTVALYDGFSFPIPSAATTFSDEYLAANGKIYLTSGNGIQHLHEINYPDSAGIACDVQQHAVSLGVWHFRTVPNHPNYNLGPVTGSICDSLGVGIPEIQHDFHFGISPNPLSNGSVKIIYLLPQNQDGELTIFNIAGQVVFRQHLPPWSTLQYMDVSHLVDGVYSCLIRSGAEQVVKKLVVTGNR